MKCQVCNQDCSCKIFCKRWKVKPGSSDKGAKTKPSQYTKKFKQMYGEVDVKIPELLKLYQAKENETSKVCKT